MGRPQINRGVGVSWKELRHAMVFGVCARHPSQLYEALLEGLALFVLLFLIARLGAFKKVGLMTGVFAICYGLSRFFVEYFRVPDPQFSLRQPMGLFTVSMDWFNDGANAIIANGNCRVGLVISSIFRKIDSEAF